MDHIEIRPVTDIAGCAEVERLQLAVWGMPERGAVPDAHLLTAADWGGVLLAAYDGDRPVGFCYGFVGLDGRQPLLCSHMLAVLPEYRSGGLGERLKLAQARAAMKRGLDRIVWTFDPLESRNAYLNLHRLGATAAVYYEDRYGPMADDLNRALPTDRLLADWRIGAGVQSAREDYSAADAPLLNPPEAAGESIRPGMVRGDRFGARLLRVAVPEDVTAVKRTDVSCATDWRLTVRNAFVRAFAAGYTAVDLQRGPEGASFYLLEAAT